MTCAIVLTYACLHYRVSKNHHIWICHLSCICMHDHYESPYIDMTCVLYMYARIPRGVVLTLCIVVYIHYHMTTQPHWPYMDIPCCIYDICLVYVCAYTPQSVFNIVYSVHRRVHYMYTHVTNIHCVQPIRGQGFGSCDQYTFCTVNQLAPRTPAHYSQHCV